MSEPAGYSRSQIWLHWIVVVLVAVQFLFNDAIGHIWHRAMNGTAEASFTAGVALHVVTGVAILLLVIWRLVLRARRGAPAPVSGHVGPQEMAAAAIHWGLYLVLALMVFSGLGAWFGMLHLAGEVHEVLKVILLGLMGLHVLAALFHQFVLRDNLLKRMKTPAE